MARFDLQGHRGARGLKPENTLPAFEVALDAGVTTIETDIHLTSDGIPVLYHDAAISDQVCRQLRLSTAPDPASRPLLNSLSLAQVRGYVADINRSPDQFPTQDYAVPPLTEAYAEKREFEPYWIPTLSDLFAFLAAYAGRLGERVGKTDAQRARAEQVRLDLELKRVPFRPELMGDNFDARSPALLEKQVVKQVLAAKAVPRTVVRSFDHRAVLAVRRLEPGLAGTVLTANTAPVSPAQLARLADAAVYGPDFEFLDLRQVKQCHAEGVRVVPWTVNDPAHWQRLLDWGVDGITTDYPDQLAQFLKDKGIEF